MIRIAGIKLPLSYTDEDILDISSKTLGISKGSIKRCSLFKRSIDARHKNDIHYVSSVDIWTDRDENRILSKAKAKNASIIKEYRYDLKNVKKLSQRPVVVGFGPAGMFSSLILARFGARPVIIERGSRVENREKKINDFWENRILDENCNVQFGEGGAGTFSDGKLNTGTKDTRIRQVLLDFNRFGAPDDILYDSKPHIGTDHLKNVVKNIREEIIRLGGEFYFDTTMTGIKTKNDHICSVICKNASEEFEIETNDLILAIGHSARDTFTLLKEKGIIMEQKPFAVGARIEHLKEMIDDTQYGKNHDSMLKSADYKLFSHLKNKRTVYTFCMCPGGRVIASSSEKNSVVTNGMSLYKRDDVNSNSALLVNVTPYDFKSDDVLAGMYFQRDLENKAFIYGGENYSAPVQRVEDFLKGRKSTKLGYVLPSYLPNTVFCNTDEILPPFITESMKEGIKDFSSKLTGFDHPDALITSVESRSSSPVRILRNNDLESVSLKGIYPCGEGAGYAGGIMSAAVDGIKCAEKILTK